MNKPRPAKALYEGRWIFLTLLAGIILSIIFHFFILTLCFVALIFFCLWFFREPERKASNDDSSIVLAPADGTVTLIDEVDEEQYFKCRMQRISIFLSVFDVHVNRTPIQGEILFIEGRGGLYLDARHREASLLNESLFWVFGSKDQIHKAVAVKQITGAIARRIVPWAQLGESMDRGERFGMIRFGSRTDLYLPMNADIFLKIGQKTKGGETAIARIAT